MGSARPVPYGEKLHCLNPSFQWRKGAPTGMTAETCAAEGRGIQPPSLTIFPQGGRPVVNRHKEMKGTPKGR
jgi:hypothetical protein